MKEYFNIIGLIALILIGLMIYYIIRTLKSKNVKWRKAVIFSFFFGLFICMVVSLRDGYGFSDNPMIPMESVVSTVLSILGISNIIVAIISIFKKNDKYHKFAFIYISSVFIIKLLLVEIIRIIYIF